jgi:hypothetical protein
MSRAEHEESLEDVEGIKRCDVIALATHRRGGLQRWVMGSVTEHVLRDTKLPLLVVPPQRQRMPARSEQTEEGNMGIREQDTSAIFSSVR